MTSYCPFHYLCLVHPTNKRNKPTASPSTVGAVGGRWFGLVLVLEGVVGLLVGLVFYEGTEASLADALGE
jgi:hypothetical protein